MADEVIRAEVTLRSDGLPPQTNLDLVCASLAGAYGPMMKEVATTGLDFIAANLRHIQDFHRERVEWFLTRGRRKSDA